MTEPVIVGTTAKFLVEKISDYVFGEALSRFMRNRAQLTSDILQRRLAAGGINVAEVIDQDDVAAMIFGYLEAGRQGAARRNLRMLADILARKLATPPIYASEFLRWSRILADLGLEEIITLSRLHAAYQDKAFDKEDGKPKDLNAMTKHVIDGLIQDGIAKSHQQVYGTLAALQRTGLVWLWAGGYGGAWHLPTPQMDELLKLVDIEAVIAEPDR